MGRTDATLSVALLALAGGLLLAPGAHAQAIGRLFSTVEERLRLDEMRDAHEPGKAPAPPPSAAAPAAAPEEEPLPQLTVNGVVLRSSGNHSSWLNGEQIRAGEATAEGIRVEPRASAAGPSVRLVLPSGADTAPIRPGQRIDVATGRVIEAYRRDEQKSGQRLFPAAPGADVAPEESGGPGAPGGGAPRAR